MIATSSIAVMTSMLCPVLVSRSTELHGLTSLIAKTGQAGRRELVAHAAKLTIPACNT